MPKKPDPAPREFRVGDKLQVKLHDGRTVDATIRAIADDGDKLQVDFGHEETAFGEGVTGNRLAPAKAAL